MKGWFSTSTMKETAATAWLGKKYICSLKRFLKDVDLQIKTESVKVTGLCCKLIYPRNS